LTKKIIDDFSKKFNIPNNFLFEEKSIEKLTDLMYLAGDNEMWLILEKIV